MTTICLYWIALCYANTLSLYYFFKVRVRELCTLHICTSSYCWIAELWFIRSHNLFLSMSKFEGLSDCHRRYWMRSSSQSTWFTKRSLSLLPTFPANTKGIPPRVYTRWSSPSATKWQIILLIAVMLISLQETEKRRWKGKEKVGIGRKSFPLSQVLIWIYLQAALWDLFLTHLCQQPGWGSLRRCRDYSQKVQ